MAKETAPLPSGSTNLHGGQGGNLVQTLQQISDEETILDIERKVFGDDCQDRKLVVSFGKRPYLPLKPDRQESPPRLHVFYGRPGFRDYLLKYGGEHVVILANPVLSEITAVLDETAQYGRELISFCPMLHPIIKPWVEMLGRELAIRDFVKFIMSHRRCIVEPDGKELVLSLSQIRADTAIELQQGTGKSAVNGLMVTTKIQGQAKAMPVDLPDVIAIRSPLFVGDEEPIDRIEFDLILNAPRPESVVATLTSSDLEQRRIEAFEAIVAELSDEDKFLVGLGEVRYSEWEYIHEKC